MGNPFQGREPPAKSPSRSRTASDRPDKKLNPPPPAAEGGRKFAFLVGIKEYDHNKLKPLAYTENDVVELGQLLGRAGYSVVLLSDSQGARDATLKPTLRNIQEKLTALLDKTRRGDLVLLGLAGHGMQFDDKEDSYFCPLDANPSPGKTQTLLSLKSTYQKLDESGAGVKLLLIDACRDDPGQGRGRGIDSDNAPPLPGGVAALYSCKGGQRAFEHDKYRHGVFFHHVLQGLRGQARNARAEVTWDQLQAYVREQVSEEVPLLIGEGAHQDPNHMGNLSGRSPVLLTVKNEDTPPEERKNKADTPARPDPPAKPGPTAKADPPAKPEAPPRTEPVVKADDPPKPEPPANPGPVPPPGTTARVDPGSFTGDVNIAGSQPAPGGGQREPPRQYYEPGWTCNESGDCYRRYYYKTNPRNTSYCYHYVVYSPPHPDYVYYYNPVSRQYWGRYELDKYGKGKGYALLAGKDRKALLSDIPEEAFPKPGEMPPIPGALDQMKMLPPPDYPQMKK